MEIFRRILKEGIGFSIYAPLVHAGKLDTECIDVYVYFFENGMFKKAFTLKEI